MKHMIKSNDRVVKAVLANLLHPVLYSFSSREALVFDSREAAAGVARAARISGAEVVPVPVDPAHEEALLEAEARAEGRRFGAYPVASGTAVVDRLSGAVLQVEDDPAEAEDAARWLSLRAEYAL